jgi:hypothetical protein
VQFHHPNAAELVDFLENAISSGSLLLSIAEEHLPKLCTAICSSAAFEI